MSRDPERMNEVLLAIKRYWRTTPDLRLAQIVGNAGQELGYGTDPYYMEDEELLDYLHKHAPRDPYVPRAVLDGIEEAWNEEFATKDEVREAFGDHE